MGKALDKRVVARWPQAWQFGLRLADDQIEQGARLVTGSRLAEVAGATEARINSSHHQSIDRPGEGLRVTATAEDGVVEGVEWTGDRNWVVGVQWHPERMAGDAFSERLFREFVEQAKVRSGQLVR